MESLFWQSFLHYSFMSIDLALRACFILIGEKNMQGEAMNRKDILGNEIKSECVGCAIVRGEVNLPGGIIYDGESIILAADPEIPIPGFLIITSKRHIQSFAELTVDERAEIGNTIAIAERAIKDLKIAETVTLVQEERSKHFHIWIFPNQEWMLEKYGYGLQYLRDINAFAKDNASDADIENVIRTAEEIKKYIKSANTKTRRASHE